MKITALNEKLSETGEIAICTSPPINGAIFDKLQQAWKSSPVLHSTPIKTVGGLLIVRISLVTPEITKAIQQLLDEAEQAVFRAEDEAQEQAEAHKNEERKSLVAAAKVFGVPIQ